MKNLLALLALTVTTAFAEAPKVCLVNQAGGLMVLTHETCKSDNVNKNLFPYHAYATESNGTIHTGCYDIPSIDDAQKEPGTRIIPVVNYIDASDGQIITLNAEWFSPEACKLHTEI